MNHGGPQGASQTYNDASKLLATANDNDLSVSDYGGYNNGKKNRNQANKP